MNRVQRRAVERKRRLTFAYAVASVLTVGVIAVVIYSALQQRMWSLAWFGCWTFAGHQLVMLVIHVYNARRAHYEHEALITKYTEEVQGRRYAS